MPKIYRHIAVVAAVAALLSGCESDKLNYCPSVSALVEASSASVLKQGMSADPSNILYTVEVTGVTSSCDVDKTGVNSDTSLTIAFRATRAPSASAAHYTVPYFVAISQTERILAKKQYSVDFSFDPGQTVATFTDNVDSAAITAGKDHKTFDYIILVGLQLSRAQLQFNRANGRPGA